MGPLSNYTIPDTCADGLDKIFWRLCDLKLIWPIVAESFAALGVLVTSFLFAVYLRAVRMVVKEQTNRNIYLVLIIFLGCLLSFLSVFSFILAPNSFVCSIRRWGLNLPISCFYSPIIILCAITWMCPYLDEIRFSNLLLTTLSLIVVQIIILVEWMILRPPLSNGLCEIEIYTYPLSMIWNYFLAFVLALTTVKAYFHIKKKHATQLPDELGILYPTIYFIVLSSTTSIIWAVITTYGLQKLDKVDEWAEASHAFFLILTTYVVIFSYIIPLLRTMYKIKKEEEEHDNISSFSGGLDYNQTPAIDGDIPMVGIPTDFVGSPRIGLGLTSLENYDIITNRPTPAARQTHEVNGVNKLEDSKQIIKNEGHLNATLELHEEDMDWRRVPNPIRPV